MIVFNPHNIEIINERLALAKKLLNQIPVKHCFISGSFLFKEKYKDIDIFAVTRKKNIKVKNKNVNLTLIDFNDLYSLFFHSLCKSCISKNLLPRKPLKVSISDYWQVINEAVPAILNKKDKFHKSVRFLVLYTEYFKNGNILDTFELNNKINQFKNYSDIFNYINSEVPEIVQKKLKKSYIKRFFYTQAGFYKDSFDFKAQRHLYNLTHLIING